MTPWVLRLLFANIGAYFVQLTMPALTDQLAFIPAFAFREPWTIVTYMFLHGGMAHILFNMLGLYFFGPRVEARIGSTRFVQLYFVSGIFGALLSMLFAWQSPIIGASGAILASPSRTHASGHATKYLSGGSSPWKCVGSSCSTSCPRCTAG